MRLIPGEYVEPVVNVATAVLGIATPTLAIPNTPTLVIPNTPDGRHEA
jgi:hypothetical protein